MSHTRPHVPQFSGSSSTSMQVPLQNACPVGQAHAPPWHVLPPLQTWQAAPFVPHAWSLEPAAQVLPVQQPLQVPPLQVQTPPWQAWLAAQATPQPPQFAGSVCTLKHFLPHFVVGGLHFFFFFFFFSAPTPAPWPVVSRPCSCACLRCARLRALVSSPARRGTTSPPSTPARVVRRDATPASVRARLSNRASSTADVQSMAPVADEHITATWHQAGEIDRDNVADATATRIYRK